ncbi:Dihydroxyacetone kinase 2 [Saccharomyces pastorianus]|uniref:Dihydroxyacetone kinase 2 n=2 Tax=Saccharomyces pastorianus TaxID=27292 RepID=A0A6C1E582_SACPS|nr:Dihydroxyacetone kinase 2 [Saccharomyces pastorianus]
MSHKQSMSHKQFKSDGNIVAQYLFGLARSNPGLTVIKHDRVIFRTASAPDSGNAPKVTLVSGGGSGHEPTHAGFVGEGALDAAAAGAIFASPSTKQIFSALKAVESPKGTLIIVKNYTGDIIHFGLAAERAKAAGMNIELVAVGDDVSVGKSKGSLVGRRGLGATALVHKIAGAAASHGLDLSEVAKVAQSVVDNSVTINASLDHCSVPGHKSENILGEDEYEIGMGIHNESGTQKSSPLPSIPELVAQLLPLLLGVDEDRSYVKFDSKDDVVLMVNNMGGMSNLELGYATEVISEKLIEKYHIIPKRTITGAFVTALNGPGFGITLLNASKAGSHIIQYFDYPTTASGWNQTYHAAEDWKVLADGKVPTAPSIETVKNKKSSGVTADYDTFAKILLAGIARINEVEPKVTWYDTIAGDGDCGTTLVSGGKALTEAIENHSLRLDDAARGIEDVAHIVEDSMGGTSGGLYSIYLSALAKGVDDSGDKKLTVETFKEASQFALEALYKYTRARPGYRTLIDALQPFVETLNAGKGPRAAAQAAIEGAEKTRKMDALVGRASYVAKEELSKLDGEGGLPDPGAIGLAALLDGLVGAAGY